MTVEDQSLVLTSFVVSSEPKISVIPDFLSLAECQHLINIGEDSEFESSLVGRGQYAENSGDKSEGFENVISENRTSLSVIFKQWR